MATKLKDCHIEFYCHLYFLLPIMFEQLGEKWHKLLFGKKCKSFLNSMHRIRPDVDIVNDLLKAVLEAQPLSGFIQSLMQQYVERGGLSKKQLQGLYQKAAKIKTIPPNKLATLEAMIMKRPTRYKSELPATEPLYTKDENMRRMLEAILEKYPQHKRVLFLHSKFDNNEVLTPGEVTELEKFFKMLVGEKQ